MQAYMIAPTIGEKNPFIIGKEAQGLGERNTALNHLANIMNRFMVSNAAYVCEPISMNH